MKHKQSNKRALRRKLLCVERLESRCLLAAAAGDEFPVNVTTEDAQFLSDVAMDASGDFVAVWSSVAQDGDELGVFGRQFSADGTPKGDDLPINATTLGHQLFPRVASDANGAFIVVWEGDSQSTSDIFGQLFDTSGSEIGDEFTVNTTLADQQLQPDVARNSSGDTVVVWDSFAQDGDGSGIFGQRFDAAGNRVGEEFQVNQTVADYQFFANVAVAGDGSFVVVWESVGQDGDGSGIYARRFDTNGNGGDEFRVNTDTTGDQVNPAVAINAQAQFVVVWNSEVGDSSDVVAQRFDSAGMPMGDPIVVNQQVSAFSSWPRVSVDERFDFAVAWDQLNLDNGGADVVLRQFDRDGDPKTNETLVNSFTAGDQAFPAIAGAGDGALVVVWESMDQDGSRLGVFGQRFIEYSPSVDLNGAELGIDYAADFFAGSGPISAVADTLTVTDIDSTTLASVTATLASPQGGVDESLSVNTSGTEISASYDPDGGVLSLTGDDLLEDYQSVLRTLMYQNDSATPIIGQRIIEIVADDGTELSEKARSILTLAGSACSWNNPLISADVDGNGSVEPVDLLVIVTEINGKLVSDADGKLPPISHPDVAPPPFLDVAECNGYVTPVDILVVITAINALAAGEGEPNGLGTTDFPEPPGPAPVDSDGGPIPSQAVDRTLPPFADPAALETSLADPRQTAKARRSDAFGLGDHLSHSTDAPTRASQIDKWRDQVFSELVSRDDTQEMLNVLDTLSFLL